MTALHHLFPRHVINLVPIHPLMYEIYLEEVLAPEAAIHLIEVDLGVSHETAITVFKESRRFGINMHNPNDPDTEQYIISASQRAAKTIQHDASIYRSWIASGSALPIDQWLSVQKELENDLRVKQEELELDPLADSDMPRMSFNGMGHMTS